jgi:hypothetical protein
MGLRPGFAKMGRPRCAFSAPLRLCGEKIGRFPHIPAPPRRQYSTRATHSVLIRWRIAGSPDCPAATHVFDGFESASRRWSGQSPSVSRWAVEAVRPRWPGVCALLTAATRNGSRRCRRTDCGRSPWQSRLRASCRAVSPDRGTCGCFRRGSGSCPRPQRPCGPAGAAP